MTNKVGTCAICGADCGLWRCREHYRCDDCGSRESLCHRKGGVFCDECHKKRAAKQVAAFAEDTSYTPDIICPWCGESLGDSWELSSNSDELECENCEHAYTYERIIDVTYSTSKVLEGGE